MKLLKAERKIWILCGIYFLLALCSLMARATADSLFLKNFDKSSIPLMIMAAAMADASICGLGHTAAGAVRSAIALGLLEAT